MLTRPLASVINISAPDYQNRVAVPSGYNPDIIRELNNQFPAALANVVNARFSGSTLTERARAIYNYLRNRVTYKPDSAARQVIQLPSRLLVDTRQGDCKSLALAAAAFMAANGFNNVRLRYASYKPGDSTPSHVYAVASDESGRDIIVDPVYRAFNAEAPYTSFIDYPMKIEVLSGPPVRVDRRAGVVRPMRVALTREQRLMQLQGKVRPGGFIYNLIANELLRVRGKAGPMSYPSSQLDRYARFLEKVLSSQKAGRAPIIAELINLELSALRAGRFNGNVYTVRRDPSINGIEEEIGRLRLRRVLKKISPKKIFRAVKKVGLVPVRKAFLALVSLNARGLAKRMNKLSQATLKKIWVNRFGGKLSVLNKAIRVGKDKRPLFGASKKVRAIRGIGYVIDSSESIGAPAASVAALLAAAAPILVVIVKALASAGVPEEADVAEQGAQVGESTQFSDVVSMAASALPGLNNYLKGAAEAAQESGMIPDRPESAAEAVVNSAIPGDDFTDDPAARAGGSSSTLLLGLGALLAVAAASRNS